MTEHEDVITCMIDGDVSPGYCPVCRDRFAVLMPGDLMKPAQRVAEMRTLRHANRVPLKAFMGRVSDLIGRNVMTHELAESVYGMLIEEARTRIHPTKEQVLNKIQVIKPGMPVIVVDVSEDDSRKHRVYRHDAHAKEN